MFVHLDKTAQQRGPWCPRCPLDAETLPDAIEAARQTTRDIYPRPGSYEFVVETEDGTELHRETVEVKETP